MMKRTVGVLMRGTRLWVALVALHSLLPETSGAGHHRRSMPPPTTLPLSKGGWRPVINQGLPGYGAFAAAPLHAPSYKVPVQVDSYSASSRPAAARDATKLTSIAQSYRPTTLRSLPASSPPLQQNQPINSYHNPFGNQNSGMSHFKIVQNFPSDIVIRNPHNPYAARPAYSKYPNKQQFKQQYHNSVLQQFNNQQYNNQPYQFAYPTSKPQDVFVKPVEMYVRPTDGAKRPQTSSGTEIFKPEVYKIDSDTQSNSPQQVKTAQQHQGVPPSLKPSVSAYSQFPDKFAPLPPSILGTFNSYGVQSIKGRDPVYQPTRTTYLPPQPTKQTIFNSFSFAPYFKSTPTQFQQTTPKFQTTLNQIHFGTAVNDFKATPTVSPKVPSSVKVEPTASSKPNFKPSPQDPFAKPQQKGKPQQNGKIQASTYNPNLQSTTAINSYFIQNFNEAYPSQHTNLQGFYNQPSFNFENKKHKIHDSIASSVNQQPSSQFFELPKKKPLLEATQNAVPIPATYEVTENYDSDDITHSSWTAITDSYDHTKQQRPHSEEQVTKDEFSDGSYGRPSTTPLSDLPEEYAIVTEGEKGYENSLNYDSHVETQSRRPLGDDFEPIGKNKLKDYYYKVSTPSHDEYTTHYKRKYKSTTEATTGYFAPEVTKQYINEALPTLPPNKHFKRPSALEPIDKDKIRKRNKLRRRRPPLANINRDKEESSSSTRKYQSTTEYSHTTDADDHTYKSRIRAPKPKPQSNLTTPTVTTDLSTSVLPTISPTSPTIVKKKVGHRRPITTTTDKQESTTQVLKEFDSNRESTIMKIATRPQHAPRVTTTTYDYKSTDTPDYSHKQDEKDTPTSDISLGITEKAFSFHKDVKPIEAKLEPLRQGTTTEGRKDNTEEASDFTTTTPRENYLETTPGKAQRPRMKNKYESSRPKFSVKDYRNRLSSTSTTDKPAETVAPKVRFPQRRLPYDNKNNSDNDTERKKFIPKEPRHKPTNASDGEPVAEKEIHSTSHSTRHTQRRYSSTTENSDAPQKISSRIRSTSRRPKPTEDTTESLSSTTVHIKRPLRKKIKDSEIGESVQDVTVTETTAHFDHKEDITSERTRSESSIMKIAKDDKKHHADIDHLFEHSKRVSDLTLAASKDYNTPGMFKTVSPNSRRVPNYFTIATDDPILPIEAFFPQLNGKKES